MTLTRILKAFHENVRRWIHLSSWEGKINRSVRFNLLEHPVYKPGHGMTLRHPSVKRWNVNKRGHRAKTYLATSPARSRCIWSVTGSCGDDGDVRHRRYVRVWAGRRPREARQDMSGGRRCLYNSIYRKFGPGPARTGSRRRPGRVWRCSLRRGTRRTWEERKVAFRAQGRLVMTLGEFFFRVYFLYF